MSSIKRTAQDKPKFRSVANVIRAGIMVDRSVLVHVTSQPVSMSVYKSVFDSSAVQFLKTKFDGI